MKKFDKDSFLADLASTPFGNVYSYDNPDDALSAWYQLFLGVLDRHAPLRQRRVKKEKYPQWLTKDIIDAMAIRDELKRNKQFEAYRKQRNRVQYLIREAKKASFVRLMENKADTSSMWKALNSFTKSRQTMLSTPLSADTFNKHFLSIADSLINDNCNTSSSSCVSDELKRFCADKLTSDETFNIPFMTVFEVKKAIEQLKNKRSLAHDGINTYFLKLSLPYITDSLTFLYNLIIHSGIFPDDFKIAKVIPLAKSNDTSVASNFRPISLLSILSKPIERHVHTHLNAYLDKHGLLYRLQSGFRSKHSCHTALTHLTNAWLTAMNRGEMTGAVFLDFSKAFDLVNHHLLVEKLSVYQLSKESIKFFTSYLNNRRQYVFVNGQRSSEGAIKHGVPQGSILGPLLFSVYINDLPLQLSRSHARCSLFADDTTIDVSSHHASVIHSSLQKALLDVYNWCSRNYMVLNPKKSESMLIATRQKLQLLSSPLIISLNSTPIKQVCQHKLLGIVIDDRLEWHAHVDNICKKLSKNLHLLSRLSHFTDVHSRQLFYYSHIQSHLGYASTVWDGCSDACIKRLNSLHRRSVKLITGKSNDSTEQRMKTLHILPLRKQFLYNKGIMMYKICHAQTPSYLSDLFSSTHSPYISSRRNLSTPRPRLDIFKNSLSYAGAKYWNTLPLHITETPSLRTFKTRLFNYLTETCI